MPAPQGKQFAKLAKLLFNSKQIKLPIKWADLGIQYPDAFELSELVAPPNKPLNLFKESTLNKYNVDTAKDIGGKFEKYIDGVCEAMCGAIDKWMKAAKFSSVQVAAVCAVGAPGCISGPALKSIIEGSAPKKTKMEKKYSKAIAAAFSDAWKSYQDKLTIPGLPWYPAFATFPGPQAPPTPNVPMPLITLPSAGEADLAPAKLKKSMEDKLGDKDALHAKELFDSIASAFAVIFLQFKSTTTVTKVMGKGSIPSFAPPVAPVGPVVGGDVVPAPGIFV